VTALDGYVGVKVGCCVGAEDGLELGIGVGDPTTTVMATLLAVLVAAAERVTTLDDLYTLVIEVDGSSTMPEP
jgi:hypothetical protein